MMLVGTELIFCHSLVLRQSCSRLLEALASCGPDSGCRVHQTGRRSRFGSTWVDCTSILGSVPDELARLGPPLDLGRDGLHAHSRTGSHAAAIVPSITISFLLANDLHLRGATQPPNTSLDQREV